MLLKARRRFRVGGVDCVVGFVLILSCWIVLLGCVDSELLGLFFWFAGFVAGGLCGFRCDTGVGCWVCFSGLLGLLLVDCVDSGVIPVWVARFVFLVCWVCCRWIVWIQV